MLQRWPCQERNAQEILREKLHCGKARVNESEGESQPTKMSVRLPDGDSRNRSWRSREKNGRSNGHEKWEGRKIYRRIHDHIAERYDSVAISISLCEMKDGYLDLSGCRQTKIADITTQSRSDCLERVMVVWCFVCALVSRLWRSSRIDTFWPAGTPYLYACTASTGMLELVCVSEIQQHMPASTKLHHGVHGR